MTQELDMSGLNADEETKALALDIQLRIDALQDQRYKLIQQESRTDTTSKQDSQFGYAISYLSDSIDALQELLDDLDVELDGKLHPFNKFTIPPALLEPQMVGVYDPSDNFKNHQHIVVMTAGNPDLKDEKLIASTGLAVGRNIRNTISQALLYANAPMLLELYQLISDTEIHMESPATFLRFLGVLSSIADKLNDDEVSRIERDLSLNTKETKE